MEALYPSIPLDEGVKAVENALEKYRTQPDAKPSNHSLIELLKLVLNRNCFVFNGGHYKQIKGTAMGTRVAPAFANIFLNDFEEKYVYTHSTKPLVWFRFIDDIFSIFTCGRRRITQFIDYLNSIYPGVLKFTATISDVSVDFLDTTVKIDTDRKVYTTLYSKPTDTHNYLLYTSAHPRHCKDNTPFSQLLRIRKICKMDSDFVENAEMILGHFHRRGYPLELLKSAWQKAKNLDRATLLSEKQVPDPPSTEINFFLTTTYNPAAPDLKGLFTKNWDLISIPPYDLNINQTQIKKGYRRCPNLKDKLCTASIDYPPQNEDDTPVAAVVGTPNWPKISVTIEIANIVPL